MKIEGTAKFVESTKNFDKYEFRSGKSFATLYIEKQTPPAKVLNVTIEATDE